VKAVTGHDFDITFNDYIPTELWGKVKIYINDKSVDKIIKMDERAFTVELPPGIPTDTFDVFARVGDNETSVFKYELYAKPQTPTPTPSPTASPMESATFGPTILTLLSFTAALVGVALAIYFYRRSKFSSQAASSVSPPEEVEELHLPQELPPDLVDACVTGECVLYAGAGLSAQSGLPTWKDFVLSLLDWALDNKFINDTEATSFRAEINKGQADPVADSIVSKLRTKDDQVLLQNYLRKVFLKRASPSSFHSLLKRIKFSAVLTPNFDTLIEGVYETPREQVYTPKDTEPLLTALTKRAFFVLKLYGTLDSPDEVIIAPAQYENAITGNRAFSQFMETLFFSRTLLFVGASLEGIEGYLRGISFPKKVNRKHYAVVAVSDYAWRAKADLLERRYGITVLPYTPRNDYAELGEFLTKLTNMVEAGAVIGTESKRATSRLKRISLVNIGPFDNLELEFDAKWEIFLGDNGVGKSTVLKAIALALCGQKAQPYAWRLLKRGCKDGKIILETDNKTSYVTNIDSNDSSGEVEINSTTAPPLEAEGWLAIGFPPLRTTSWEPPKGPDDDVSSIKSRPVPEDLLPLVRGDVDPRLDKLKQWIVKLDYLDIKSEAESKGKDRRYYNLLKKVFDVIGSVTEGMAVTYVGVEKGTKRVIIKTSDGTEAPLEALSQGTISLIGWVGILMQRLYEVFDEDEDPTQRYALILMDEIDAHMHPAWQRTLVNHLKDIFPEAQFIATTHSPLVVSGMPVSQVVRFARDKHGKVNTLRVAPDMTLGYSDQILTSMLFGLPTTLDDTTEKKMKRYYQLYEMKDRGEFQKEYERLKQELMVRVPPPSASYEEKRKEQLSEANMLKQLGEQLQQISPEGGQVLLSRANNLRESIDGGKSSD
jgi:hypothetical protein